jgi:hypothetical protein
MNVSIKLVLLIACSLTESGWTQSPVPFSKQLVKIDAGTVLGNERAPRWNKNVMLAKPRIASGNVTALSESIRTAVSDFVMAIAATVDTDPQNAGKFRLTEVGVGYAVSLRGQLKVVHADNYKEHGADLGFIQRQVLSENEKQLENMQVVARASSLMMFDVPAILLVNNVHEEFVIRHLIWIDANSGRLAAMHWLLGTKKAGAKNSVFAVIDKEPMRWIDTQSIEDRIIHVDGNEFTLGIPNKRAFALNQLPPGRLIDWTQQTRELAGLAKYELNSLQLLLNGINAANQASLKSQTDGTGK